VEFSDDFEGADDVCPEVGQFFGRNAVFLVYYTADGAHREFDEVIGVTWNVLTNPDFLVGSAAFPSRAICVAYCLLRTG